MQTQKAVRSIIKKEQLTVKRPGTGRQPIEMEKIIGKKTKKTIQSNTLIKWDDII